MDSGKIKSFVDLKAWQEGHQLALSIYKITKTLPSDERFGLTDQLRRCAVSITSNLAEGFSRYNSKEKRLFYRMALGSLTELQSQLMVARDVGYIDGEFTRLEQLTISVSKLINGLIKYSARNT